LLPRQYVEDRQWVSSLLHSSLSARGLSISSSLSPVKRIVIENGNVFSPSR